MACAFRPTTRSMWRQATSGQFWTLTNIVMEDVVFRLDKMQFRVVYVVYIILYYIILYYIILCYVIFICTYVDFASNNGSKVHLPCFPTGAKRACLAGGRQCHQFNGLAMLRSCTCSAYQRPCRVEGNAVVERRYSHALLHKYSLVLP